MSTNGKWIAGLIGIAGLALVFLWWKKNRKQAVVVPMPVKTGQTAPPPATVNDKIVAGYIQELSSLNDAEIKKYSELLASVNDTAKAYQTKIGNESKISDNLALINSFNDLDFVQVVKKWKADSGLTSIRDSALMDAMLNGASNTQRTTFYGRVLSLIEK